MKKKQKNLHKADKEPKAPGEGYPSRATFHHGSTTQGGSDFGQGSVQLPDSAAKQGSESNDGANYDGESGWNNEALRRKDIPVTKKEKNRLDSAR